MTSTLYVDWFLLSKLFLKHILSSPLLLHEYDVSHHKTMETEMCAESHIQYTVE